MTEKIGVLGTKTPQRTGVERVVNAPLPTVYGKFQAIGYMDHDRGDEQVALVYGEIGAEEVLTRLHSECLTGDAFGSQHCECGAQLESALRAVVAEGSGIVVYLRGHEGRGIGLLGKLRAMALQAEGLDTVEANVALGFPVDARDYKVAADILRDLGVESVRLMSNNPRKREALTDNGIRVAEEVPLLIEPCENNITYLRTKRERMDHRLPHLDAVAHWS
ncbi:GTP cyclohydrolase II [Streptomyces sp. ID05-04B]|uniref:GTP cyclohydrolase II n=1 Tax=unclassified Streptomyces TaxID=2593676 RepID=UPI000D1A650D|nr:MULTISPECIES: GTP cyclohydrolase II [unclassified Streptomyces]AVV45583.1 GTP cyclohydrolase II [Streptomyces sp. P3]MCX5267702.1 GTP cyclohydrolase II [Streptomyces sp. NBC_00199]MDX3801065.1 GTP cyclohydrolase II [Streptomyces sp. AK04-3B]MDX5567220.1 GTP cyclohydrolase II [Streptomyces sp. ID05-04B]